MINDVTLQRVPDGAEVPAFSLSLFLDADSWTWGFEASLPAPAETLIAPVNASGPVELLASVNETALRVLAENISRERCFGEASTRSVADLGCRPMHNVYQQFRQLLPDPPLQLGTVSEIFTGVVTVQLPGGGIVKARGSAAVGQNVFVRDGVVEVVVPNLTLVLIEV